MTSISKKGKGKTRVKMAPAKKDVNERGTCFYCGINEIALEDDLYKIPQ